jgi:hypothetical protein
VVEQPKIGPNAVLRFLLELFAIFSFGFWGFTSWPAPWNIVVGIAAPLLAAVVWGLFRSPRARFTLPALGRTLVEVLVMGGAAATWFATQHAIIAAVFAAIALVSGSINLRSEVSREASA